MHYQYEFVIMSDWIIMPIKRMAAGICLKLLSRRIWLFRPYAVSPLASSLPCLAENCGT